MFALWPGDQLNFSIFIKPTFGFAGQRAASEAGHIANTNVRGKPHWTMRLLFIALTFLVSGQVWSQPTDNYVRTIEKLRSKDKLTTKSSVDKTFVGSVTGYYDKDSIVLISSLSDAEAAGTETLYFIKDGILKKAFVMEENMNAKEEKTEVLKVAKQKCEGQRDYDPEKECCCCKVVQGQAQLKCEIKGRPQGVACAHATACGSF
jgi:hypothetical protein